MKITVLSGKGGTGKTTVATNLAWLLSKRLKVQLLDADVEEPDTHLFFPIRFSYEEPVGILKPVVNNSKCINCGKCVNACQFGAMISFSGGVYVFDSLCKGCGVCKMVCPTEAISEIPKAIGKIKLGDITDSLKYGMGIMNLGELSGVEVIRQLKKHIDEDADVVIIDAPPGTSCPVVESLRGMDFAILVTEPTPFGLSDLRMALEVVKEMGIPSAIIVNRYDVGFDGVEKFSKQTDIPILCRIPFDKRIASLYSEGRLFVKDLPEWSAVFNDTFEKIRVNVK